MSWVGSQKDNIKDFVSKISAFSVMQGPSFSGISQYIGAIFVESLIRRAVDTLVEYFMSCVSTSVTLDSRDETFRWVMEWIREHPSMDRVNNLHVCSSYGLYGLAAPDEDELIGQQRPLFFSPTIGNHWITHKGKWLRFSRIRGDGGQANVVREQLVMRMFFANKELLKGVIREAQKHAKEREGSSTSIYVPDNMCSWVRSCGKSKRSLSSVILKKGMVEELLDDVCNFYELHNWYRERGIPWRRGYLLEGKPGCGKTSFVTALAGELSLDIYTINLSSHILNDETLTELLANTPKHCLLLLEDVDVAACTSNEDRISSVTRSGLLNAIDGVVAVEGRIFFMTSNSPGVLDNAFLRPGRVDMRKHFPLATSETAGMMFSKFFPDEASLLADRFAERFEDDVVNLATVQGFLMAHRDEPETCVEDIEKLFTDAHKYSIKPQPHISKSTSSSSLSVSIN